MTIRSRLSPRLRPRHASHLILERLQALLTHQPATRLEPVTQEFKALARLAAVANPRLVRMEGTSDITLSGQVTAKLFASTTGSDSDWVVKLIDVYPEKYPENWRLSGFELMIADEIFRGRFRHSFEKPEPVTPGEVTPFTIDLHTANHVFKKGHRIMVQVQSTWFPLYDRNPQKFVPNIFEAKESDYQKATQHIYRSKAFPSSVEISVLPANRAASAK